MARNYEGKAMTRRLKTVTQCHNKWVDICRWPNTLGPFCDDKEFKAFPMGVRFLITTVLTCTNLSLSIVTKVESSDWMGPFIAPMCGLWTKFTIMSAGIDSNCGAICRMVFSVGFGK